MDSANESSCAMQRHELPSSGREAAPLLQQQTQSRRAVRRQWLTGRQLRGWHEHCHCLLVDLVKD
ncbi:uncharacterized protein L969DRAFT_55062 [Mixia osmundae IAM 14324]|uniref:Uncharacterized protein n=1 Tax=Mixia osmundae (strain CBS 9802 / IAM 14324 / JCM 22182 / KY 12970) TaxID=764103 RepID=G7DV33_MIXOS|nr:uncharacterized protein L969DRAFT_55062 [Mixia osmundae IAM 14324]KEI36340.1 hypothetical protein L969DRAFT_55062 [Mixia osmundae IAM 14324]GAA94443.1 hypothetical protein E5Q_01095 [Mixia osmundae IAM 14324]